MRCMCVDRTYQYIDRKETTMKPYLIDVPVRINIWIRPECQRKQFEVIKKARPSILFVTSDGGRNAEEWELIKENRKIYDEEIDWDCKVYKLYMDHNLGLYAMARERENLIWSTVDRCIMLEDDILPSVSYFRYCAELLEKYKDDERIECICGMNHLGQCKEVGSDYFFSRQGSIWGTAVWRRSVTNRGDFTYVKDPYVMKLLKQRTSHNKIAWNRLRAYGRQEKYEGHVAATEFWYEFDMYAQNRLQIIPKINLVSNIGATANSAHAADLRELPKSMKKVFNNPIYEMNFPMKHAKYVIPDVNYEIKRNKMMAYNMPLRLLKQKIGRFVLMCVHGNFKGVIKKIIGNKDEK